MPPSLFYRAVCSHPLILALSPGRGNRFVDADCMLKRCASFRRVSKHNDQS